MSELAGFARGDEDGDLRVALNRTRIAGVGPIVGAEWQARAGSGFGSWVTCSSSFKVLVSNRNPSRNGAMSTHEAVNQALGRIAEVLVEREAKVDLNGILEVLEELGRQAYRQGYDDGLAGSDEERNASAERDHELRFGEPWFGE